MLIIGINTKKWPKTSSVIVAMWEQALSIIAPILSKTPTRKTIGQRWLLGIAVSLKMPFNFLNIANSTFYRTRTIRLF